MSFTKEDTKTLKGVAILLMLAHHLFGFMERWPLEFGFREYFWVDGAMFLTAFSLFARICATMFFFLGGYGLSYFFAKGGNPFRRIKGLYLGYWKIFVIFIPLGFLTCYDQGIYAFDEEICTAFSAFSWKELVLNFLGLTSTYNREWWFLRVYAIMMLFGWLWIRAFRKCKHLWVELLAVNTLYIILWYIFPGSFVISSLRNLILIEARGTAFLLGLIFAKYDLMKKMRQVCDRLPKALEFLLVLVIFAIEFFVALEINETRLEFFMVAFFVLAWWIFADLLGFLKKPLRFCGKYSTDMWLTHSFYCYYFLWAGKLVYATHWAVISYVTLLAMSLGGAVLIEAFYGWLGKAIASKRNRGKS